MEEEREVTLAQDTMNLISPTTTTDKVAKLQADLTPPVIYCYCGQVGHMRRECPS